jgi:hypothetical protein
MGIEGSVERLNSLLAMQRECIESIMKILDNNNVNDYGEARERQKSAEAHL